MEHFSLDFPSLPAPLDPTRPAAISLCGVVASGNLEVLVEAHPEEASSAYCSFEIHTAAEGFQETWEAVLQDFCARNPVGGLRFLLNDVGATPAVVALRLAQASEDWQARSAGVSP